MVPPSSRPVSLLAAPVLVPGAMLLPGLGLVVRGEQAGWKIMTASAALFTGSLISAFGIALSGAGDVPSGVFIPIALMGIGGYFVLGTADAVGAFSEADGRVGESIRNQSWNADRRVSAGYVFVAEDLLDQRHFVRIAGTRRLDRLFVSAEATSHVLAEDLLAGARAGYRVAQLSEPDAGLGGEGLWLELGLHHEWNRTQRFSLSALEIGGRWELPMVLLSPAWTRTTGQLRLGLRPMIGALPGGATTRHFELTGGFEARWTLTDWLRPFWGYEHARDRLAGGRGTGFVGTFYAGAELQLAEKLFLDARGLLGDPGAVTSNLEWRW